MPLAPLPRRSALILAVVLAACGDRDTPPGTSAGAETPAQTVTVSISDSDLQVPASLTAGPTTFSIDNASRTACTFRMEAASRSLAPDATPAVGSDAPLGDVQTDSLAGADSLPAPDDDLSNIVPPGEQATLTITLRPGTYRASCSDTAGMGASAPRRSGTVTVRSAARDASAEPGAAPPLQPAPEDDPTRPDQ